MARDNRVMFRRCHATKVALVSSVLFLCLSAALAQVAVTPAKVTMVVGESQPFRAVDAQGHMLTNVHWTVSRSELGNIAGGAEVEVIAKQPGSFTLTAHAGEGYADAQVEILQGPTLPMGTIRWTGVDWPGCKTAKIIPAVPSETGVADVFEDAECADGHYIAAYTADGIMAWRRKSTAKAGEQPSAEPIATASQLNTQASICDSISLSMKRDDVRALLMARQLTISSETDSTWVIEEEGTECRLWFDRQFRVSKKRRTFVSE